MNDPIDTIITATWNLLGRAHWNLSYAQWLEKVGGIDDIYWRDRWNDWKQLNALMGKFDPHTIAKLLS